jgi:drug/metabolite transporter (DMT)-like permease
MNYVNMIDVGLLLLSALLSSFSQLLLKKSTYIFHANKWRAYINGWVISAYFILLGCTILVVFAYRGVPLSFGPMLEASSYIYIMLLSAIFFKEKITRNKLLGNILIVAGIFLFSVFG